MRVILKRLIEILKRFNDFIADWEKADFGKKIVVYFPVFVVVEAILLFGVGYFLKLLLWLWDAISLYQ